MTDAISNFQAGIAAVPTQGVKSQAQLEAAIEEAFAPFINGVRQMDSVAKSHFPDFYVYIVKQETNNSQGHSRYTIACGQGSQTFLAIDAIISPELLVFTSAPDPMQTKGSYAPIEAQAALDCVGQALIKAFQNRG